MAAATAFAVFVCYALFNQPTEDLDQIEPAAVASPRTPWSSRSANQSRKWTVYHASLAIDAKAYQSGKSSRLVLMGDSITEAWVGTGYGSPTPRAEGVPAVLNETLARHWPPTPLVLAISGDQTQHVLWRVAQGEVSKAMARQHDQSVVPAAVELAGHGSGALPLVYGGSLGPNAELRPFKTRSPAPEPLRGDAKVADSTSLRARPKSPIPPPCATQARDPQLLVSLLIGTNNLGHGHSPEATGKGVLAVARSLLSLTRGKLLINALLPRGDSPDLKLCPPRCNHAGQPYTSFGPAVRKANALVAAAMPSLEGDFPGRVGRHGRSAVLAVVPQLATSAA